MRGFIRWAAVLAALTCVAPAQAAGPIQAVPGFGTNPGSLDMFKYVPPGLASNAPLVLVLHGCAQQASDMDDETGWPTLADRLGVALVLPRQRYANWSSGCFRTWDAAHRSRGVGEALSIKQMVDYMAATHGVDTSRVFINGFSDGGFMTNVMLATYPELFRRGATLAGGPYGCANNHLETTQCALLSKDRSPGEWGDLVRAAVPGYSGSRPPVLVIHGREDPGVTVKNMTEVAEQWTDVHGVDLSPDSTTTLKGHPWTEYHDASGTVRVATWLIHGLYHGYPTDPGTGPDQCGANTGLSPDVNVCGAFYVARWFGLV